MSHLIRPRRTYERSIQANATKDDEELSPLPERTFGSQSNHLNLAQKDFVASMSFAILKDIPRDCYYLEANPREELVFNKQLKWLIDGFLDHYQKVPIATEHSDVFRNLEKNLVRNCQEEAHELVRQTILFGPRIPSEHALLTPGEWLNDVEQLVFRFLTRSTEFSELTRNVRKLAERRFCDQNQLICQRIMPAIQHRTSIQHRSKQPFQALQAVFYVDWDIRGFLHTCYPSDLPQGLRSIVALTGTPVNARLATIEEYLQDTWPRCTWELLDALYLAITDVSSRNHPGKWSGCVLELLTHSNSPNRPR